MESCSSSTRTMARASGSGCGSSDGSDGGFVSDDGFSGGCGSSDGSDGGFVSDDGFSGGCGSDGCGSSDGLDGGCVSCRIHVAESCPIPAADVETSSETNWSTRYVDSRELTILHLVGS